MSEFPVEKQVGLLICFGWCYVAWHVALVNIQSYTRFYKVLQGSTRFYKVKPKSR